MDNNSKPNCFPFFTISSECDKRWYSYATPSILIDVGLTLIIFWIFKGRGRDHRVHLFWQYKLSLRVEKRVNAPKRQSGLNMIGCVIISLFVVNLLHFFLTFDASVLSTLDMDLVWLALFHVNQNDMAHPFLMPYMLDHTCKIGKPTRVTSTRARIFLMCNNIFGTKIQLISKYRATPMP
jgi:hypothetical protein